jgi:predicted nucleic acid-binding protein
VILADTSLWVGLFRERRIAEFAAVLAANKVLMHSAVLGELATGNLQNRAATLSMLRAMPKALTGTTEECLALIEAHKLYGRGVGWIDVQLLVAARLSHAQLWSLDTELMVVARKLRVAYRPQSAR